MIVKIEKSEKSSFEKNCACFALSASFFTMETNANLLQVEILDNGKEISLQDAFNVGRLTGMEKLHKATYK